MPIFEYVCSCGKVFEVVVTRQSDRRGVRCPACQGRKIERVISRTVKLKPGLIEYRPPDKKKVR